MTIDLRLTAPRPTYAVSEDVVLGLEIENRGPTAVKVPDPETNANWQPTYELRGPGPQDVARFDFRTVVRGKSPVPLAPADASLIEIPPGATHTASLYLSGMVPLKRVGDYSLSTRLVWDGIDVTSAPLAFSIEPLRARAFTAALCLRQDGKPEIYTAWLHDGRDGTTLFQSAFGEDRPDLGEMGRRSIARICAPAPTASEVWIPSAAHSRLEDLVGWVFWREGGDLCGQATMSRGQLRMALPFEPVIWAYPPLESRSHTVDFFVIGGEQARTLAMLRVVHGGLVKPPQGSVVWTVDLPEPVIGIAVAGQPKAHERIRHLALISGSASGNGSVSGNPEQVTVRHAIVDGTNRPSRMTDVTLDEWTVHPGTPPAILAHDRGGARISVLLASPNDPARCRLTELLFGPPHPSEPSAASTNVHLPVVPTEGQIRYYRHPVSGAFRRDWALRGTDGATYSRGPGGFPAAVRLPTNDPPPLSLIALASFSYLLERSPEGAFRYEHV